MLLIIYCIFIYFVLLFLKLISLSTDLSTITEAAICFVESCQRLFDDSILKCHENEEFTSTISVCIHIDSALKSTHVATPLPFKAEALKLVRIPENTKEMLWLLCKENDGVLVHRISKGVMVVKCQVAPKHPLGYLHVSFFASKGKEKFDRFVCSCADYKGRMFEIFCVGKFLSIHFTLIMSL